MASPVLPVDIADLQKLVPTVSADAAQIFIDSADAIVHDKGVVAAYPGNVAYLIELYVAAHFASLGGTAAGVGGGTVTLNKVGNSEERYADPSATFSGIASSPWGMLALQLDTKGLLASLATTPIKAQIKVYSRDSDADTYPQGYPYQ